MYEIATLDYIIQKVSEEFPEVITHISPSGAMIYRAVSTAATDNIIAENADWSRNSFDNNISKITIIEQDQLKRTGKSNVQCRTIFITIIDDCYHIYIDWINGMPSVGYDLRWYCNANNDEYTYSNFTQYIDGSLLNPNSVSSILKTLRDLLSS